MHVTGQLEAGRVRETFDIERMEPGKRVNRFTRLYGRPQREPYAPVGRSHRREEAHRYVLYNELPRIRPIQAVLRGDAGASAVWVGECDLVRSRSYVALVVASNLGLLSLETFSNEYSLVTIKAAWLTGFEFDVLAHRIHLPLVECNEALSIMT